MLTLGIDTSNYATSLAVFDTDTKEVVCDSKRFLPVRQGQRGLRQSEAVFHHTVALPELLSQLQAKVCLEQLGALGVSAKPCEAEGSYMPCFLVGQGYARAMAAVRGIRCVHTTHQQGHIAAALYAVGRAQIWQQQTLLFHVSGGTTDLLLCRGWNVLERLGGTQDLYAGQAVDRVGVRMGLSFPAGEQLSALAMQCTDAVRPKASVRGMTCSLSGLENQCYALLDKQAPPAYVAKYCLSAVAHTILALLRNAAEQYPDAAVVCAGGVMSSEVIRAQVQARLPHVCFVPARFSSDNAIGVALIAAGEEAVCRGQ